jgi:hypothetical protein
MNLRLELPQHWVDRTVLTYVGPDSGSGSPSIVVTRDELGAGVSLGRYAAMQDGAVRAGIDGVELVDDRETTVAGRPAVSRTYRWTYGERSMRQRMWCLVEDGAGYAVVATAADEEFDGLRAVWAQTLASISFGE